MAPSPVQGAELRPLGFSDIDGWSTDDPAAALACFRRSAATLVADGQKMRAKAGAALRDAAAAALAEPSAQARRFFETRFMPFEVVLKGGSGLLTGYYEPEVEGRLQPEGAFQAPLLGRPTDLVSDGPGLPAGFAAARRTPQGLVPYYDRSEIEAGALRGRGLELVYLAGPVEVFFAQVQGSVRVRLPDRVLRLRYAGRNGHPYTAIGKVVVDAGLMRREDVTMQSLRAWLAAHPADVRHVLGQNRSYVFFAADTRLRPDDGPRGGAGVPLTAGRSLAVDRSLWPYGTPLFVQARLPRPGGGDEPFARLLIAQDTGTAIVGAARGDLFLGSGFAAGEIAGLLKSPARFVVLIADEAPP